MAQLPSVSVMMTIDEFLKAELPEGKAELVRGELRMTPPPGGPHGIVAGNLLSFLMPYVKQHRLGRVLPGAAGFELLNLPRTVRCPDVSFVRAERLPHGGVGPGLLKLAPDLAVEVLSPSETPSRLEEKLDDYRASGIPLVWVINPDRRTVMIVAADAPVRWVREGDTLEGENVVPGFVCQVTELFEGLASRQLSDS